MLAAKGLTRVLVEGGPRTWNECLAAGVVDEAVVYVGAEPGPVDGLTVIPGGDTDTYFKPFGLRRIWTKPFGDDTRLVFRRAIQ